MPAYLTHRIAAQMVQEKLAPVKIEHDKAFYLGSQGPDILFFRNYQPSPEGLIERRICLSVR